MPLLDHELARRSDDGSGLELRNRPLRVKWTFDDLVTSDGHAARCAFECSVRALPDPTELRMLQEVMLDGRRVLTVDEVAAHFQHALQGALANTLRSTPVAQGLADEGRKSILDALKSAAHPVAFSSGVEVLPPFHIELESPSFQQERLREMQRALAERHAAGQVEHLQRAGELLKQFQSIRQSAPELSAGQVLEQINPTDRGSMLQTLLLAGAQRDRATALWAVAGPYLVRIDARVSPSRTELIPLPPTLGPLRSVQAARVDDERVLLVGARAGFMVVHPDAPSDPALYHDDGYADSQLGFSGIAYDPEQRTFTACHGDAGVVRWAADEPAAPSHTLRTGDLRESYPATAGGAAGPRNCQFLGNGRVVFSMGNQLIGMDASNDTFTIATGSGAEVAAIVADDARVIVAQADGNLCAIDRATAQVVCKHSAGVHVRTAGALPWLGNTRLLLATADGAVQCVGMDDSLVTRYSSPQPGVAVVAGSADVVAAVSHDRQRLLLWNTWDGRQPAAEIYMTGLTRHRVADVDFG